MTEAVSKMLNQTAVYDDVCWNTSKSKVLNVDNRVLQRCCLRSFNKLRKSGLEWSAPT
ncbi:hypothetical protein P7K49_006213 [Saguinus oedipus]|uniref:Uncharacterized protein n=1 Tax=Saguinus oedipus TaxID=9490 RepID=A0ABQ9W1R5_SAGOE|nr:hypothetical protein P7K49_006213 [Saguinus oedipus]